MIYNPDKPILNKDSYTIAKDSVEQLYTLNQKILQNHFKNRNILTTDYMNLFKNVYEGNLCERNDLVKLSLIPFECKTFVSSTPTHVSNLYPIIIFRVCNLF